MMAWSQNGFLSYYFSIRCCRSYCGSKLCFVFHLNIHTLFVVVGLDNNNNNNNNNNNDNNNTNTNNYYYYNYNNINILPLD